MTATAFWGDQNSIPVVNPVARNILAHDGSLYHGPYPITGSQGQLSGCLHVGSCLLLSCNARQKGVLSFGQGMGLNTYDG
jgi:hypothetical protein